MSPPDEHIVENRRHWNDDAPNWVDMGRRAWASPPSWGIWSIPETELGLLPERLDGLDSIELGCGTGYVSCWVRPAPLAGRGPPFAATRWEAGDLRQPPAGRPNGRGSSACPWPRAGRSQR